MNRRAFKSTFHENSSVWLDRRHIIAVAHGDNESSKVYLTGGNNVDVKAHPIDIVGWWNEGEEALWLAFGRWLERLSDKKAGPLTADERKKFWSEVSAEAEAEKGD